MKYSRQISYIEIQEEIEGNGMETELFATSPEKIETEDIGDFDDTDQTLKPTASLEEIEMDKIVIEDIEDFDDTDQTSKNKEGFWIFKFLKKGINKFRSR